MDKKEVKKLMIKVGLVFLGVIFLASLAGIIKGYLTPIETSREVTLANYSHQGEFALKTYSRPKSSPETLFLPIVESLEILFGYSFDADQPLERAKEVEVKAILADQRGRWAKEILLVPKKQETGNFQLSFPLEWEKFLELGKAIEEELAPKGSPIRSLSYLLTLEAAVKTQGQREGFVTTLKGKLSSSTLEWDGFENFERGSRDGINYWQLASFGYQAKLKNNLLFGPITLKREANPEKPGLINPETPLFTELVKAMDVSFSYHFEAEAQIASPQEEVKVEMVMESPNGWQKTFPLIPPTKKEGKFAFTFPLDLDNLRETAREIDEEIGLQPAPGGFQITLRPQVRTMAEVGLKTLDEVFEPQLKFGIEEKIERSGDLTLTKKGAIKKEVKEFNLFAQQLRNYAPIGSVVSFPGLFIFGLLYWQGRPRPSWLDREAKRRKKYKEFLSEVIDYPPVQEGEMVINLSSLEELAKTANNLVKPILYQEEPDRVDYWILDGSVRYQYTCKEERPEE